MIALAGAIALGPRLGRKFKRDGGGMPPGHDMILAALGGVILWFGWYGFNPGSTLSAMDFTRHRPGRGQHHARGVRRRARRDALRLSRARTSGIPASASTGSWRVSSRSPCPCYWVSPFGAICIGADRGGDHGARGRLHRVAAGRRPDRCGRGARCVRHLRHDQPRACSPPVNTACRARPVPTRRRRSKACSTAVGPSNSSCRSSAARWSRSRCSRSAMVVMYAVKALGVLRVSEEVELGGIDIHEHGAPAYHPEFAYMGHSAIPSGSAPGGVKLPRVPTPPRSAYGD